MRVLLSTFGSRGDGALFADWVIVRASTVDGSGVTPDSSTPKALAFVLRDAPGLQVVDDWDGMGQRTTASGTVTLDDVRVPTEHVVTFSPIFTEPTVYGAQAQLLHAEAARQVDAARADLTDDTTAAASIAVAVAKVAVVRASLEASSVHFDLGGTRSASAAETCPNTGATPEPTRCTTPVAGKSSTSAGTPRPAPGRRGTVSSRSGTVPPGSPPCRLHEGAGGLGCGRVGRIVWS